ncbi:MAG: hypothetical protein ACI4TK_08390 [Agathobacter sp.]
MTKGVFSEFDVLEQNIKASGDEKYSSMSCVGSSEEELEVKVIIKKCRGAKAKEIVKGTGNGKLKESLHVPYEIYNKIYAMTRESLIEGVSAYGQNSKHPEFAITQKVLDEDDEVKYKAYPRCIIEEGPKRSVENGAEEVPELELTIALLPDEYGECMYEALESNLDETVASKWLEDFTPEMVQIKSA